ncbi:MAG: hypothetical protein E7C05_17305 [Clostridium botulinum]|uniref:hypothetical protein n=1 Tax=Clostridium sporogenes TaxID=1509 RepID=UPI001C60C189|nr:hypothetical protein [Clostridium sporogenes]MBW5458486.1 hypothetical protein [Clostridium sporogenes]MDU2834303.1 hypothetical protein [Clostridium botulinum]
MAIYVGGDRTTLEYNLLTKVAGSMTECPMKCYYAASSNLLVPTDIRWIELSQERYDKIKNQDNVTLDFSTSIVGEKIQLLIELDLNGLCNSLYGGSNAIFEQNVKSIQLNAVIRGQGSNGGVLGYLSKHYLYRHDTTQYIEWGENSTNSLITSSNEVTMVGTSTGYITENNKIYMLLVANYPASSTILSALHLDYISIGLKLNRQPDKIQTIDIELGEEWSLLFKGVSFYETNINNTSSSDKSIFVTRNINNGVGIRSYLHANNGVLYFFTHDGKNTLSPFATINLFSENQRFKSCNLLFMFRDGYGIVKALINGSTIKEAKFQVNTQCDFTGNYKFYLGEDEGYAKQADAFVEDVQILSETFTDEEAEIILKSKNPNIVPNFKDGDWYIHPNASTNLEGTILTLVATANYQGSSIVLPILPNNRYKIDVEIEDINNLAHIAITQKYNNTNISSARVFDNSGNYNGEFITQDKVNTLGVACQNTGTGTFKFKNLRLKRLD